MNQPSGPIARLRGDWPFPAGKVPVFYGWIIAGISTFGFLFSVLGQTMGMAVFADSFIEVTGLSRTELSWAYMFGTIASASRNVSLLWFEQRRGLVSGVRGGFVSLGFSLSPLLLAMLIDQWQWHTVLWWLAGR